MSYSIKEISKIISCVGAFFANLGDLGLIMFVFRIEKYCSALLSSFTLLSCLELSSNNEWGKFIANLLLTTVKVWSIILPLSGKLWLK